MEDCFLVYLIGNSLSSSDFPHFMLRMSRRGAGKRNPPFSVSVLWLFDREKKKTERRRVGTVGTTVDGTRTSLMAL